MDIITLAMSKKSGGGITPEEVAQMIDDRMGDNSSESLKVLLLDDYISTIEEDYGDGMIDTLSFLEIDKLPMGHYVLINPNRIHLAYFKSENETASYPIFTINGIFHAFVDNTDNFLVISSVTSYLTYSKPQDTFTYYHADLQTIN